MLSDRAKMKNGLVSYDQTIKNPLESLAHVMSRELTNDKIVSKEIES